MELLNEKYKDMVLKYTTSDFERAQEISDSFNVEALHSLLDYFAETFCPIVERFVGNSK